MSSLSVEQGMYINALYAIADRLPMTFSDKLDPDQTKQKGRSDLDQTI